MVHAEPIHFRILSLDGKRLRTASKASDSEIHILSLIDTVAKVFLEQRSVGEKTNEIPVAQKLLNEIKLDANTIVTADAMHTQTKTAEAIIKKTLITSLQSKTINRSSNKLSSVKHPVKFRWKNIRQWSLDTDG